MKYKKTQCNNLVAFFVGTNNKIIYMFFNSSNKIELMGVRFNIKIECVYVHAFFYKGIVYLYIISATRNVKQCTVLKVYSICFTFLYKKRYYHFNEMPCFE